LTVKNPKIQFYIAPVGTVTTLRSFRARCFHAWSLRTLSRWTPPPTSATFDGLSLIVKKPTVQFSVTSIKETPVTFRYKTYLMRG
jgi:hypothetical protein